LCYVGIDAGLTRIVMNARILGNQLIDD